MSFVHINGIERSSRGPLQDENENNNKRTGQPAHPCNNNSVLSLCHDKMVMLYLRRIFFKCCRKFNPVS